MSSTLENKILNLQERLKAENKLREKDKPQQGNSDISPEALLPINSSTSMSSTSSPIIRRPRQRK